MDVPSGVIKHSWLENPPNQYSFLGIFHVHVRFPDVAPKSFITKNTHKLPDQPPREVLFQKSPKSNSRQNSTIKRPTDAEKGLHKSWDFDHRSQIGGTQFDTHATLPLLSEQGICRQQRATQAATTAAPGYSVRRAGWVEISELPPHFKIQRNMELLNPEGSYRIIPNW